MHVINHSLSKVILIATLLHEVGEGVSISGKKLCYIVLQKSIINTVCAMHSVLPTLSL